jgi:hypothetical protein
VLLGAQIPVNNSGMSIQNPDRAPIPPQHATKLLIVLRSFNDIDHIVPLVHFMLTQRAGCYKLELYYARQDAEEISRNPNIIFLRKSLAITVRPFGSERQGRLLKGMERARDYLVRLIQGIHRDRAAVRGITQRFLTVVDRLYYYMILALTRRDIDRVVDTLRPDVICTDVVDPRAYPYGHLFHLAKNRRIPLVAFPHGLTVFDEPLDQAGSSRLFGSIGERLKVFDYILAPNKLQQDHIARLGYPVSRIKVLGSLRYETRWLSVLLEQVYSEEVLLQDYRSPKIVLFLNKLVYRGSADSVNDLIRVCSEIGSTVVKPHTRDMDVSFIHNWSQSGDTVVVDNTVASSSLIEWCDIALFWGTSMGIQVIARGKPFVYPSFAHGYQTIYETYFLDRVAASLYEVRRLLSEWRPDTVDASSAQNREQFLRDIVYAGDQHRGVAERYCELLDSLALARSGTPLAST